MTAPSCSVVVCTRHRATALAGCIESLQALEHPSYEIVVVDNSPGDDDVRRLVARAGAKYVHQPRLGLSRARNSGAAAARGEVVAFLDDDATADPGWLREHESALRDRLLMVSTGRILPMALDDPSARTYHEATLEDLGPAPLRVMPGSPWWFELANFSGLGMGGNMAFKRELFENGWRFRESLGMGTAMPGGEENHAFFTILRAGHGIAYLPQALVYHYGPTDMASLRQRRMRMMRAGCAYMLMLLIEEPEYRSRTLRYVREGVRGKDRVWRPGRGGSHGPPRWQLLAAATAAPFIYARARLTRS